jgi:chemotaxis protein methyltransferase CheR
MPFATDRLSPRQFREIRDLVHRVCGIDLQDGKEGLVRTRLQRRQRELGLASLGEYLARIEADASGRELAELVEALTTNKTGFFRESRHFDYLQREVLPGTRGPMSFWSAGCSTGEEPYTLGMLIRAEIPDARGVRILATDISARVLDRARAGLYTAEQLGVVPEPLRRRFTAPGEDGHHRIAPEVRRLVRFARLNLMDPWPMRGPFAVFFCRYVMIYFDRATQERLVRRFSALLAPGGHLFVGHSESLTAISHGLRYVQPAIYRKPEA